MALVIYAHSGLVRRVIFDKLRSDAALEKRFPVADDENSLRIDAEFDGMDNFDAEIIQNHVNKITGIEQ